MIFLIQDNSFILAEFDNLPEEHYHTIVIIDNEEVKNFRKCNHKERFQMCFTSNMTQNRKSSEKSSQIIDKNKILNGLRIAKFVCSIILMPFVALLGFCLNLLTILIIKSKKNVKELFDKKTSQSEV